jgi:diguanylate cyclase (GGDEF)-like protein/PAS domain S-box-containing protein
MHGGVMKGGYAVEVVPGFGTDMQALVLPTTAHILIVDDEARIRAAYRQLLAAEGRQIDECGTGREAIDRLGRQCVDVLVLDLGLPDINGREVMEWVSRHQLSTSIIVFSAEDTIDAAILALRRGACEFIRKNSDPQDLVRTVEQVLRRRRIEREHALMTAQLEQSERLHRFLVENSPDIIYTLDSEGCFVFVNNRVESLLGYDNGELIGQHYSKIVHPDDRENARYAFAERRVGTRATFNFEIRLCCKDHAVRHFENRSIVAILSSQGVYCADDAEQRRRFLGTSGVLRDITERKKAEETIAYQAFHDLLTGLPNRVLFRDRLDLAINQAKRRHHRVGVMYLDIDRFKVVNDTYGHAEGDELLRHFARRVRNCLRGSDTLSRQGGDEFTILLPDIEAADAIETIAAKILNELQPPFDVGGKNFTTSASIGIAIYPDNGTSAEELLRHADIAMYEVKHRGKNGFLCYAPAMSANHAERIELENELRIALDMHEFELFYQPQVSVSQQRVIGVEALVRWRHPQRGLVPPNSFIPIAEENGLIFRLSDWVLDEACRQMSIWAAAGIDDLRVAVNISPIEFEREDFVRRVIAPARKYGINPSRFEVEITENLLVHDAERVTSNIGALREFGMRISIDDFGTRYSSLNYLRRFSVNTVKIDQSFVRDIKYRDDKSPVISAIVGIARGFDLNVIAEGVETPEQADALADLGCDDMQGFLFCRPQPAPELTDFLRQPTVSAPLANLARQRI